jgi:hypothetical protein
LGSSSFSLSFFGIASSESRSRSVRVVWLGGCAALGWYSFDALVLLSFVGMPDEVVLPEDAVLPVDVPDDPVLELCACANAGTSASAAANNVAWNFMRNSSSSGPSLVGAKLRAKRPGRKSG